MGADATHRARSCAKASGRGWRSGRRRVKMPPLNRDGSRYVENQRNTRRPRARRTQSRQPGPAATAGARFDSGPLIESVNPSTGQRLARVRAATADGLRAGALLGASLRRQRWRQVPAPKRGEAMRLHGRGAAQPQGRARQPGIAGKRQDQGRGRRRGAGDDRHRRFRRRPIAHALRPDHAFGARAAPHVRAMASARRRRRDLGVQFPGRGMVLERLPLAAICGNATVWKPSPKTALCALAVQRICNRVLERHRCRRSFNCSSMPAPSWPGGSSTIGASRWCPSPARRRSAAKSACASPSGSARACSSSAATTRSSSMKPRISIWRCPRSCSARSAPPVSAAPPRAACSVHRSRAAELERRLVAAYGQVRIGDPLEPGTLMGPLIDAAAVARYLAAIAAAQAAGRHAAVRRRGAATAGQFRRARDRARLGRHAGRAHRDLRADSVPAAL